MPQSNLLQQLHRLETSSPRFADQIATILGEPEYKASIQTLPDKDLIWLVEYLDNVCLWIVYIHTILNSGVDS
jgi:hypothetical protein